MFNIELLYKQLGLNILICGYRGYGHSTGTPSERGLELDSEAVLNFALEHKEINNKQIFIFGRSIGGAVGIYLASKFNDRLAGMIVENTFTSIADMVDALMPLVASFKTLIQRIYWASIDRIHLVEIPMLFVRGLRDEIVPT